MTGPSALQVLIDESDRAKTAEARVARLTEALRDAIPFIGWTGCPDGLVERCEKALGEAQDASVEGGQA